MSDILKGETFVDGQSVNGGRLNSLVDNAVVQPELISTKGLVTPVSGDHVLIRQASTGLLKKSSIAGVNNAGGNVTSVGLELPSTEFNVTGSPVTGAGIIHAPWRPVGANRVLAGPEDGVSSAPVFRRVVAGDLRIASVAIAAAQINWELSNSFRKTLTADTTFTFLNNADGATIHVAIGHANHLAHWPATVHWANADEPQPTLATSIFKFTIIGGVTYGWLEAVNCHL